MNTLLPYTYAGSILYYQHYNHANHVYLENYEHYIKQTYRSRCTIYGANGKLDLIIPVVKGKNGHQVMKDVKICFAQNWQRLHWKSLESAYRCSPYFEYYEHKLLPHYQNKETYLIDFNQKIHDFLLDVLRIDKKESKTLKYETHFTDEIDMRDLANPFHNITFNEKKYTQVFENKNGFIKNLSCYDLIFNCGPNAIDYLSL